MQAARLSALSLVLCGTTLFGCGGDGGRGIDPLVRQALQECSQSSVAKLINLIFLIGSVPDVLAGGFGFPGTVIDVELSEPPANNYTFSIVFDSNGNAIFDSAIVGTATFSEDPTDGLDPGATIDFSFTIQDTPIVAGGPIEFGTLTGSGDFVATLGATEEEVALVGTLLLDDGTCTAELTFPAGDPLNLVFQDEDDGDLEANISNLDIFGSIQAVIEALRHTLTATLALAQGSQTVNAAGDIDGTNVEFSFDVLPPEEVIRELISCMFFGAEMVLLIGDVFADLVESGVFGSLSGTPLPPGVTVTPVGPNVFAYTIDLAVFEPEVFDGGTIAGIATPAFAPLSGFPANEVLLTWTLTDATFPGLDWTVDGQNAPDRPIRVTVHESGLVTSLAGGFDAITLFSGAGSFSIVGSGTPLGGIAGPFDCDVTFDVPGFDPLTLDLEEGTLILTVTEGDDVLHVVLIDLAILASYITINGVLYPLLF